MFYDSLVFIFDLEKQLQDHVSDQHGKNDRAMYNEIFSSIDIAEEQIKKDKLEEQPQFLNQDNGALINETLAEEYVEPLM